MSRSLVSRPRPKIPVKIILAVITALAGIIIAGIQFGFPLARGTHYESPVVLPPFAGSGVLVGYVKDRSGRPLSNLSVGISGGPETRTDGEGNFRLRATPVGDQTLVVKPGSGHGSLTRNVTIVDGVTNQIMLVYAVETSSLGLISITSLVDGGILEVKSDGKQRWATIHGRCDGLPQVFDKFDIWLAVRSESDTVLWIQHPQAVIDFSTNEWIARIDVGDDKHPPRRGERWSIVAIAASPESEIAGVSNTPSLSLLGPHISSNVVSVETKLINIDSPLRRVAQKSRK
jgi:hypothetical protein